MKRLVVGAVLLGPLMMVAVGCLILLTQPEVVTERIEYVSSHSGALVLVILGGVLGLVGAMIADLYR